MPVDPKLRSVQDNGSEPPEDVTKAPNPFDTAGAVLLTQPAAVMPDPLHRGGAGAEEA